ncbi:mitochondrial ubiquitin ligase activator of nfkb 1-like [Lineus longissimus]|uniref:mitochondrial ubiquitin ligase activator of nfkb 1-like n=1 Tax=Lineus longissimus TaxID=88925 RepID=UPI002B4CCBAD
MPVLDLIILGIDTVITLLFYRFYRSNKEAVKKVQDAPEFDITPDLLTKVKKAADQTIPYACIRGPAEAEETAISSVHKPGVQGIIQQLILKEYRTKRSQGHWSDNSRILRDITKVVPFVICGINNVRIVINEPKEAEYLMDNLSVVHDHFEPSQTNVLEKSLDRIFGDVSKGFQETETMFPVGTKMTGIGQLSVEKGVLTLVPPANGASYILSTLTKTELVKKMEDRAFVYKVLGGIFGIAGGVILVILLKRYYEEYQAEHEFEDALAEIRELRSQNPRIFENTRTERSDSPVDGDDSQFCVVCLTQTREVVLLDCGHICLCADCVVLLPVPRKCPVCRNSIVRILPIYVS